MPPYEQSLLIDPAYNNIAVDCWPSGFFGRYRESSAGEPNLQFARPKFSVLQCGLSSSIAVTTYLVRGDEHQGEA
jgi:hypothetical protein